MCYWGVRGIQDIYTPEELEKYYRLREEKKLQKPPIQRKPEAKPKIEEKTKAEEKPKIRESTTVDLVGRRVKIFMDDGEKIEGNVIEVAKYDMIIDCGGRRLIIFKHSMKKIEL